MTLRACPGHFTTTEQLLVLGLWVAFSAPSFACFCWRRWRTR